MRGKQKKGKGPAVGERNKRESRTGGGGREQEGHKDRKRKRAKGERLLNLYALPPLQSRFTLIMLPWNEAV